MPVTLDAVSMSGKQDKKKRGKFLVLDIPRADKKQVIYRKMESLNPELSDTYHPEDSVWVEQFTGLPNALRKKNIDPRVLVFKDDETVPWTEDDGIIITFEGRCAGRRYLDDNNVPLEKDRADEISEMTGVQLPEYNLWEFCIAEVVITDGRERSERLMESVEQQRARSEDDLIKTITNAFAAITNGGEKASSPQDVMSILDNMTPDQLQAYLDTREAEEDADLRDDTE